jgi:hypothetical protein
MLLFLAVALFTSLDKLQKTVTSSDLGFIILNQFVDLGLKIAKNWAGFIDTGT